MFNNYTTPEHQGAAVPESKDAIVIRGARRGLAVRDPVTWTSSVQVAARMSAVDQREAVGTVCSAQKRGSDSDSVLAYTEDVRSMQRCNL